MIALGPQACGSLEEAASREWLVTDGLGGYAMGTVAGLRTRRYHGLLVQAAGGPSARMLGLAALDPVLVVGDARYPARDRRMGLGAVDPCGHELLVSFTLDRGVPRWRWQVGNVVLEREIAMAHGRCAVGVVHRLVYADRPVGLELTPLCTWRSVHGERFANGDPAVEATADGFAFEGAYRVEGAGWRAGGAWYRGVRAREEAARGLNDREDLWAAGAFAVELVAGDAHEVTAAAARAAARSRPPRRSSRARASERPGSSRRAGVSGEVDEQLVLAADQFVIDHDGPTAVAGYPWFGEWSRDLMTSYEGLFLSTGRAEEGREALRRAAATLSEGMLANTADTGTLEYNTVDGTLWFVHALGRHVEVTGDDDLGAELAPALGGDRRRGTSPARASASAPTPTGCFAEGEDGLGADVDGRPHRRRPGDAANRQAGRGERTVDPGARHRGAARAAPIAGAGRSRRRAASFVERFVRADGRGLLDLVDGPGGDDAALRPNQLLAVSLPAGPLAGAADSRTRPAPSSTHARRS